MSLKWYDRLMENSPEKSNERIASREELLEIISHHFSNAEITKEEVDENGVTILELKAEGETEGTFQEFNYRREKVLSIHVVYYEDDMPCGGKEILLRDSGSGGWVEIDRVG